MRPHEAAFLRVKVAGVRELKTRLSECRRAVRSGEEILITDHGRVVAELYAEFPPILPEGSAAALLDEERGEE
jgi:antitoxin (DNA-binding transcriptional repressor) of toxin-antitoxin stability system